MIYNFLLPIVKPLSTLAHFSSKRIPCQSNKPILFHFVWVRSADIPDYKYNFK